MITFWDELEQKLRLSSEELGKYNKKQAKDLAKKWIEGGGKLFDITLGWRMARGGSPFVFVVGEPMSGKTTFLAYIAHRFSLVPWDPHKYYYAGGIEDLIREFIEGSDKDYKDTVIAIDEGEGELDKWWSGLVKMLKLIHDLRGLHKRNIWAIVSPDIKSLAKSLRGLNGSLLVKVIDRGVAKTFVIYSDPADVSGSLGIRRYVLDRVYRFWKPDGMEKLYEIARKRKEQIIREEWERYITRKERKEELTVF